MWNPPNDDFFETVWLIVKQIPEGVVSSYGQIATMIPPMPEVTPDDYKRLSPRWVGTAMRKSPDGQSIPWQRVMNSQGKISLSGVTGDTQRRLLEAEGVKFDAKGKVDLATFGWQGPDDAWLEGHNLLPPDIFESKPKQKPLF
ncbi:MAG: MGMT family protein [Anaerolineae bacterium]|nr:MGMT family protein [Anaerolineae bacterium]